MHKNENEESCRGSALTFASNYPTPVRHRQHFPTQPKTLVEQMDIVPSGQTAVALYSFDEGWLCTSQNGYGQARSSGTKLNATAKFYSNRAPVVEPQIAA